MSNSKAFWKNRCQSEDGHPFLITESCTLSYSEVFSDGDALWAGLAPGIALILCDKSVHTVTAYVGALRNGIVPLMVDIDLKPEALQRFLKAYRPNYYVAPDRRVIDGFTIAKTEHPHLFIREDVQVDVTPHKDLALLLPTSGSTGDPKCVRIGHRALDACTQSICEYLYMTSARRSVSVLPLNYSYGLSVLNITIACRGSFVLTDLSVLAREFWQLVEDQNITDFSGVPFMYETMRRMKFSTVVLENLKCVTQAGGRLDPKLTRHFKTIFGNAGIQYFTMYGQTEASPRISYLPPNYALDKEGSVGIPISCGQVSIAETGMAVGEGELVYKGDNVCLGYAATRDDISLGDEFRGVLKTGDQARIDEDGFIFIVGRRKRFIKLQGISVNLDHLESVLKEHEINCMVIGIENQITICFSGDTKDKIADVIKANFAFHPSSIRLQADQDLPRTGSGKPDYGRLTERYFGKKAT